MAGEKRSLGSGNTSPHKAARTFSDESSGVGLSSSQVSQPTSSRLGMSPQPSSRAGLAFPSPSPQLDTSGLTDKSLSSMSEDQKHQWSTYHDPESFCDFAGWEQASRERFIFTFHWEKPRKGFQDWLENLANDELELLKCKLERFKLGEAIKWDDVLPKCDATVDKMVCAWIDLKKISYTLSTDYIRALASHMEKMVPKIKLVVREAQYNDAARSFYVEERYSRDQLPSSIVFRKLIERYNSYYADTHLAPYVSMVGPSGIGKSFIVQQLAVYHGIYTVYTSFARRTAFPARSPVADVVPHGISRASLEKFWRGFITVSLAEVEACRAVGITPAGYFMLQTKDDYRHYQENFASRIKNLSTSYEKLGDGQHNDKTRIYSVEWISQNMESQGPLLSWHEKLKSNNDNQGPVAAERIGKKWIPKTILCFDEARELVDSEGSLLFRSLRQALRDRYQCTRTPREALPLGDFFGVLLDTTSRIVNFSPPVHLDPSQKMVDRMGHGRRLLPPIYQIQTNDIFAQIYEPGEDGSASAALQLFRFGRPLWGGRFCSSKLPGALVNELVSLASQKIDGNSSAKSLSLISYRIDFYICSSHLADEMVSSCLRNIVYINNERDLMRTVQPSEPILAYTAATRMIRPEVRLEVLRKLVLSCFEGQLCSSGDIGEVVAALLLLFAYDEKQFEQPKSLPRSLLLREFLESLFGNQRCDDMAQRMGTDGEMSNIWETGRVYFNHFVRLRRPPTLRTLEDAYRRAAGIFLPHGFHGADIIIPIKVSGAKEMTFCAVQVKNRRHDAFTPSTRKLAMSELEKATSELGWAQSHIAIMMCLRHKVSGSSSGAQFDILLPGKVHNQKTRSANKGRKSRSASNAGDTDEVHYNWPSQKKKLLLLAMGVDESVYESVNLCGGERTAESSQISSLLEQLLSCIPGISLPEYADADHVDCLLPLD